MELFIVYIEEKLLIFEMLFLSQFEPAFLCRELTQISLSPFAQNSLDVKGLDGKYLYRYLPWVPVGTDRRNQAPNITFHCFFILYILDTTDLWVWKYQSWSSCPTTFHFRVIPHSYLFPHFLTRRRNGRNMPFSF